MPEHVIPAPLVVAESQAPAAGSMTAVVHDAYGTSPDAVLRLAQVPRPTADDGGVLVRVHAASVDRGTWHIMAGLPYPIRLAGFGFRRPKHLNPGRCFAGTVESVGPDVEGFAVGDEVYGTTDGSFAEYVVARPGKLAVKPRNLSFQEAATVPISAVTALQAVRDRGKIGAGTTVLILGASGGVGTFAVQIAKAFGAHVTGMCRGDKVDLVKALGADQVIDYTREQLAGRSERYDVILDIGGNTRLSTLRRALSRNGRLVIVGGETDGRWMGGSDRQVRAAILSPFVRQTLGTFIASENAADLVTMTDLLEAGSVAPMIDRTYPLGEVPAAIRRQVDGNARGKLVVTV